MKQKNGRLRDKGTTGLTILLSKDDRSRLNRMVDLSNHVLCANVSQASIIRRAIGFYNHYLESQLAAMALAHGDTLGNFLRDERVAIYRANDLPSDGVDVAKEYPRKAEAEIASLREAIKGRTTEQIREFLGMKPTEGKV